VAEIIGRSVADDTFPPLFFLSSPWNSRGEFKSSKVSSYLLRFQLWFIFF
jgi:hypothetical protein